MASVWLTVQLVTPMSTTPAILAKEAVLHVLIPPPNVRPAAVEFTRVTITAIHATKTRVLLEPHLMRLTLNSCDVSMSKLKIQ